MLRHAIKTVGLGLILLSFVGCLQVNTLIKVKPDGSGTIEETFLMSKEIVEFMEGMANQMTGLTEQQEGQSTQMPDEQAQEGFDIFDEAKLKKEAIKRGQGVSYVTGKRVTTDKFEGYTAIYSFTDINRLKLNQNPSDSVPSDPTAGDKGSQKQKEYVTFHLTKGYPSTLIVRMPLDKEGDEPATSEKKKPAQMDNQQSEMMMAQMKQMFEGMKITMAIEVQGSIVQTNATHREGSKITMMQLDFDKLLQMPEQLNRFSQMKPESLEAAKKLMKDLPGIKVDLNKEVIIKFK